MVFEKIAWILVGRTARCARRPRRIDRPSSTEPASGTRSCSQDAVPEPAQTSRHCNPEFRVGSTRFSSIWLDSGRARQSRRKVYGLENDDSPLFGADERPIFVPTFSPLVGGNQLGCGEYSHPHVYLPQRSYTTTNPHCDCQDTSPFVEVHDPSRKSGLRGDPRSSAWVNRFLEIRRPKSFLGDAPQFKQSISVHQRWSIEHDHGC